MDVLIKIFYISIVGVLTLGILGCGCLFPYTPNTGQNLYVELYNQAEYLQHDGEYRAAVVKYEHAFKIRPRPAKVIDIRFPALLKYSIAFCYAKLAEAEGDVSIFIKAEAAVRESYQTAIHPDHQAQILYLWGYILLKQERYKEASAKFEELAQCRIAGRVLWEGLYGLGKAYMGLDDETAARRAFMQLGERIRTFLQNDGWPPIVGDDRLYALGKVYMELGDESAARRVFLLLETQIEDFGFDILSALGKAYMELNDESAARRVFARLEVGIDTSLRQGFPRVEEDLYTLGKAYLELGDETAARQVFTQLLEHYPDSSHKFEMERLLQKQ